MDKKEQNSNENELKEKLAYIMSLDDKSVLCECFAKSFFNSVRTDDEPYRKIGFHMIKAIMDNDMDALFIAICGWSVKSILKKSNLICDADLIFHEEAEEAEFISVWDGGTEIYTTCKVNLTTHEVLNIKKSSECADAVNSLDKEWICLDGNRYPVYKKEELDEADCTSFWYGA